MLDIAQFRQYILVPTLSKIQLYSKEIEELLVFTCAVESDGGTFLHQVNGPALGIYQCEPSTHTDIWNNYIFSRTSLVSLLALNFNINRIPEPDRLLFDLKYATVIARLHYARLKYTLPNANDVEGLWEYYKQYYNTPNGKAEKDKSIKAYQKFAQLAPQKSAPK